MGNHTAGSSKAVPIGKQLGMACEAAPPKPVAAKPLMGCNQVPKTTKLAGPKNGPAGNQPVLAAPVGPVMTGGCTPTVPKQQQLPPNVTPRSRHTQWPTGTAFRSPSYTTIGNSVRTCSVQYEFTPYECVLLWSLCALLHLLQASALCKSKLIFFLR